MALFDLSLAVSLTATSDLTIKRPSATVYATNGVANAQTFTTLTTRGSWQPLKGVELRRLPEGARSSDYCVIYTSIELQARDRVTVADRGDFEVETVQTWSESGNYCKVIAKKLNTDEPRS